MSTNLFYISITDKADKSFIFGWLHFLPFIAHIKLRRKRALFWFRPQTAFIHLVHSVLWASFWRTKKLNHSHENNTEISVSFPHHNSSSCFNNFVLSNISIWNATRVCRPVRSWFCVRGKVQTEPSCINSGNNPPVPAMDGQPEAQ